MGKSKAAPERVTAAERRVKALELRKLGFTYRRIGEQLGVTESAAHKMVTTSLRELNEKSAENAEELRRLELERLDEWLLRIAQEIKDGKALGAIDRGIRIQARRAKLLGLDAPTKVEMSDHDKHLFEEVIQAAEAGDELAIEALQKIVGGQNTAAVCHDWKQKSLLPLASKDDTEMMSREELAKAAQGKLTFEDLATIRKREVAPNETEEARERLREALERRHRAKEAVPSMVGEVAAHNDAGA